MKGVYGGRPVCKKEKMGAALVEGNALCSGRGHWLMWEVPKMAEGNRGAYLGFLVF
jgi:hypothetical protein